MSTQSFMGAHPLAFLEEDGYNCDMANVARCVLASSFSELGTNIQTSKFPCFARYKPPDAITSRLHKTMHIRKIMKLGYTILYAQDVVKTVKFYENAFGLKRKMVHESNLYAEMETGETTLAFCADSVAESHGFSYRKNTKDEIPAGVEIALVTDDVEAAFKEACDAGAQPQKQPEIKPWGQTISYVRDLNGCLVEICSPVAK